MGFTKLDESILQSSVMAAKPKTFKVWIALLAACDSDGIARVSPTFLARVCYLSMKEVEQAIEELSSPDPQSRSLIKEGRRIERVDGGFFIVNYQQYRAKGISEAYKEKERERKKIERQQPIFEDVRTLPDISGRVLDVSASASASASKEDKRVENSEGLTPMKVVSIFNELTGQRRSLTTETQRLISKLIKKGYTEADFRSVIEFKSAEFSQKDEMKKYIRPATFFAEARFEDYLEQVRQWDARHSKPGQKRWSRDEREGWRRSFEKNLRQSLTDEAEIQERLAAWDKDHPEK